MVPFADAARAHGLDLSLRGRGPLTMAPSQLGIFTRSSKNAERADIGYNVIPYTRANTATPTLDREPGLTLTVYDLRPTSRGDIRLTSPDPAAAPSIRPNYLSSDCDKRVAARLRVHGLDGLVVATPPSCRRSPPATPTRRP